MNLFYSTEIDDVHIILSEEESKHVVKVMRSEQGSHVHVTDGKGRLYKASVSDSKAKKCLLTIEEEIAPAPDTSSKLHMAMAPTKNHDRMEWFAEKATEIGIHEITPLICRHSERKNIHADRLHRIMIAAMKQSNRLYLPSLHPEEPFEHFINLDLKYQKFIASCSCDETSLLKNICKAGQDALILIGPEGDFSAEELSRAVRHGFTPVSLGKQRYRTETAALVACHTFALLNEH